MRSMTKRVNVKAPVAIRNITPPIYGTCKDIVMTTGDILKCICKRAIVEEILPDGSTIRLNMSNYYTDNGAGLVAKKPEVKKPQIQNPVHIKVPVAPKEQVVETKTEEPKEAEAVEETTTVVQEEVIETATAVEVVSEIDAASKTAQSVSDAVTEVDVTSTAIEDAVVTEPEEKVEVAEEKTEQSITKSNTSSKKKSSNKKK